MATGDVSDMTWRMFSVLPRRWFPALDAAPILSGVLAGVGWAWSYAYSLIGYVDEQTRITTATGAFLDMVAVDFFGSMLSRHPGEADGSFRQRIIANLLPERATRAGVLSALSSLTSGTTRIFEPGRPADTGAYATLADPSMGGDCGYGISGLAYGSLNLPAQFLILASRPQQLTDALQVNGYGDPGDPNANRATGGYGVGAIEYASMNFFGAVASDHDIRSAIVATIPANAIAWLCLV